MDREKKAAEAPTNRPKEEKKPAANDKSTTDLNVQELEERVAPVLPYHSGAQ